MKFNYKKLLPYGLFILAIYAAIRYWDWAEGIIGMLFRASGPLILGALAAYIVNILMSFYEREMTKLSKLRKKPSPSAHKPCRWIRPVCLLLAFVTVLAVLALVVGTIVPELQSCFIVLLKALPKAITAAAAWLEENLHISGLLASMNIDWITDSTQLQDMITKLVNMTLYGAGSVMNLVFSATSVVVSSAVTVFLGLVFMVHLLVGKEKLIGQFSRLTDHFFPARFVGRMRYVLHMLNESFHSYIVGQVTEAFILGGLCAVGMLIFQLPYAVMIGALIGVTALIPIAGAYIGGAVGFIMIFSVSPLKAVLFVVYLVILQQIEGNLIYPRVVGSSLGLPGIWVLAAVTVGGGLMGIVGMLLAVPLTAAAYKMLREKLNQPKPV